MTDQVADDVQPDEGQGETASDTPYAEYLDRIPDEVRDQVEPVFKEWDANTTRRFQEASEYRKGWEPYEQLGINNVDPGEVQWLLQFREALNDPSSIQQWFDLYAQQHGLTPAQAAEQIQQQEQSQADQFGDGVYQDPSAQLEQLLSSKLAPLQQQLEQVNQWREHQEESARLAEATQFLEGQLSELEQKHGKEFNREMVEVFAGKYVDTDPQNAIGRGWADYQSLIGQVQKDYAQSKVDAPAGAESGGSPDVTPEMPKTLKEAEQQALARLKAVNAAG